MAATLANTNWNLYFTPTGSLPKSGPWPLSFGSNAGTLNFPGGYGTLTMNGTAVDIMWNEDGQGRFMFQIKGPTDTGNNELPTYTGQYTDDTGLGWFTNFDVTWQPQNFKMQSASQHSDKPAA